MANPPFDRKRQFRAALALAGLTMREWAKREGYDYSHLCNVVNGKRGSRFLARSIEAFIAEWYEEVAA